MELRLRRGGIRRGAEGRKGEEMQFKKNMEEVIAFIVQYSM